MIAMIVLSVYHRYTDLCKLKAICVENKRPSMDEKASKSRLGKLIQDSYDRT